MSRRRGMPPRPVEERNVIALSLLARAESLARTVPPRHREDFIQEFLLGVLCAPEDTFTVRRAKSRAYSWLRRMLRDEGCGLAGTPNAMGVVRARSPADPQECQLKGLRQRRDAGRGGLEREEDSA